ncbi:NAD(P)H-hydrate epimerase [Fontibacillus solani]|uniref:Bifunctional NAD(P)H-hydrate repair enzyme n=1 Tax=Fontibacillus solani TaxID=1572857 RepID=A0A7W3SP99_9BACL|nr:NAD(P)H-hydrate dehydratase [Fontibacillus solani]MBA9083589.1 NAD(P)H-hydrate epimerase [Fontibacillus solani]
MKFLSSEQMREVDQFTITKLGIPAMALMENAGRAIAEEVLRLGGVDRSKIVQHWLVLVGKGNNGGDGLVCARHLADEGVSVTLLYAVPRDKLSGDALAQHRIVEALDLPLLEYVDDVDLEQSDVQRDVVAAGKSGVVGREGLARLLTCGGYTGIVDALLGTGAKGAPRGVYADLIRAANRSGLLIVAADIPSGLDADTGAIHDPCIEARVTVSLAFMKAGLTQYPGAKAAGEVVVRYIGIPRALPPGMQAAGVLLTEESLGDELGIDVARRREADGHKGTYGHVLLAAGSMPMSGAGLLAAKAALRAGCGLATWALPAAVLPHVLGAVPELMLAPAGDSGAGAWTEAATDEVLRLLAARDVLAVGPGMGRFPGEDGFMRALWEGASRPLVVDADALGILARADGLARWQRREAATILTPHPGEMARLTGVSTGEVQRDRLGIARRFALQHGVTLVLKGARTVVAAPDGRVFVNTTGHPGMATGGSGDVLTGIIASLLAQGLDAAQAATFGVYLHGQAGERAASLRHNPAALIAGDIIDAL